MTQLVQASALLVAALNLLAAAVGGWRWHLARTSRWFWVLLRIGQASALSLALLVAVLAATGREPADGLFYLYAIAPLAVGLMAEQLRIASAEAVLEARGLASAQAVGTLPEREQHAVVATILRREMGVMALGALIVCLLALRGASIAAGF